MRWLLPEYIEDILPAEAARIEALRRRVLDLFAGCGYELVMPPLLEYLESLLTGTGHDLDLRTFKLVDQLSGPHDGRARRHHAAGGAHRRAPAQPPGRDAPVLLRQRAAHAARRAGGDARAAADRRRDLRPRRRRERHRDPAAAGARARAGARQGRAHRHRPRRGVPLAHPRGRDRAGARSGAVRGAAAQGPARAEVAHARHAETHARGAAAAAASSTAGARCWRLRRAGCRRSRRSSGRWRRCARSPSTASCRSASTSPSCAGTITTRASCSTPIARAVSGAVARGGRYDEVGKAFGRPRPATGFSIDLRALAGAAAPLPRRDPILAPCANGNRKLAAKIATLRRAGEVVIEELPGHARYRRELGCTRELVHRRGAWVVKRIGKAK